MEDNNKRGEVGNHNSAELNERQCGCNSIKDGDSVHRESNNTSKAEHECVYGDPNPYP